MDIGIIAFILVGVVAGAAAIAMAAAHNMVYSILYMVVVFLATAVLYLLLHAPVIAFLQMPVYAGGIMVLFLFVVMLIGAERMSHLEPLRWQCPLAFGWASILLLESVYIAFQKAF